MHFVPLLAAVAISHGALAQKSSIDCDDDVSIANAADARRVSKNCDEIGGDLWFVDRFNTDVTISGVKTIKGSIIHSNAGNDDGLKSFSLRFDDLEQVRGDVDFSKSERLFNLTCPDLTVLNGTLTSDTNKLDMDKLEFFGALNLTFQSPGDAIMRLGSLKGFASSAPKGGFIQLNHHSATYDAEPILNTLFNNTFAPSTVRYWPSVYFKTSDSKVGLRSKEFVIGWPKIGELEINGFEGGRVTLGSPLASKDKELENMQIQVLLLNGFGFRRSDAIKNLRVGKMQWDGTSGPLVDFDDLGELEVSGMADVDPIQLTKRAEEWDGFNLIAHDTYATFTSTNSSGETSWYWPKEMGRLDMNGAHVGDDFFDDFFKRKVKVTELFRVNGFSVTNDVCDQFDKVADDQLPDDYECEDSFAMPSLGRDRRLYIGVSLVAAAVLAV